MLWLGHQYGVPARCGFVPDQPAAAKEFLDKAQQDKLITSDQYGAAKHTSDRRLSPSALGLGVFRRLCPGKAKRLVLRRSMCRISWQRLERLNLNNYQLDKTFRNRRQA